MNKKANTSCLRTHSESGSPGRARTADLMINREELKFGLKNLLSDNPYNIPEQMLKDWMTVRKKQKSLITQTLWNRTKKQLAKCQDKNIDPIEAFETMVANGWKSMKVEYFEDSKPDKQKKNQWDVDAVMRA